MYIFTSELNIQNFKLFGSLNFTWIIQFQIWKLDLAIINTETNICQNVNIAIPADHWTFKKRKSWIDLYFEKKRKRRTIIKVIVVPIITGELTTIPKCLARKQRKIGNSKISDQESSRNIKESDKEWRCYVTWSLKPLLLKS